MIINRRDAREGAEQQRVCLLRVWIVDASERATGWEKGVGVEETASAMAAVVRCGCALQLGLNGESIREISSEVNRCLALRLVERAAGGLGRHDRALRVWYRWESR